MVHSELVTRLLVVSGLPVVHEGMSFIASRERNIRVDWKALNADEALGVCQDFSPDMAVVGMVFGDQSSLDLVKALDRGWPRLPILVMSLHDETFYANCALRAGARGYIMMNASPEQLILAIRTLKDGGIYLSEKARARLLDCAVSGTEIDAPGAFALLTEREREVFRYIGKGLKKGQIAALLNRSVNTVETHRSNIKKKFKIETSGELARLAFHCCQNDCEGVALATRLP